MSVTIADLMKLPSLEMARVIAGEAGLSRLVSSISVLECMDARLLSDELFSNDEFYGGEIVITSFVNAREDIEVQCSVVRRLHEGGEVGLILFYVGVFMPCIDPRLTDLCNELGFTLICMPKNRMDCRYSEVITEVTAAIIKDRMKDTYFVGEMLERIAALPVRQKTMDTVLRLLSDRLRTSFYLTDEKFELLNFASWPRAGKIEFGQLREYYHGNVRTLPAGPREILMGDPVSLAAGTIHDTDNAAMCLIMVNGHDRILEETARQAAEVVRLFISIWGQGHGNVGIEELVKAILNDEPIKMRRLAEIFHIDIAAINQMIMVMPGRSGSGVLSEAVQQKIAALAGEVLDRHYEISMFGTYQDHCLLFTGNANDRESSPMILKYLYEQIRQAAEDVILISCPGLMSATDVRNSFLLCREFIRETRSIYPGRQVITVQEVKFAGTCHEILSRGEEAVEQALRPLRHLDQEAQKELYETLEIYLLDAGMNIARTAEYLFVHKNTIKYRIANLSRIFHGQINKMPEAYELYQAAAVNRLLRNMEFCPKGQREPEKLLPKP